MWAFEETSHWHFLAEKLLGWRELQRKSKIHSTLTHMVLPSERNTVLTESEPNGVLFLL